MILVSHNQSSEGSELCESALDYISSPVAIPESVVLSINVPMILSMRRKKVDSSLSELFSMGIAVVCFISYHSLGSLSRSPRSLLGDSDIRHNFFEESDLSWRGRVGMASQRNTLAIDHHQVLRSLAPLRFSDRRAPFFAGMNVASTKDSSQSRIPFASNSERNARHISLKTPASCQYHRRRQHVEESGYSAGRSCHLAPVLRIQRIPSKHARSGAGGRPPLGLGGRRGINGLIFSHCSSVNIGFRTLIGLPPMSLLRETSIKYNGLFNSRYRLVKPKHGFCNHF
jgi:hypothetical protein